MLIYNTYAIRIISIIFAISTNDLHNVTNQKMNVWEND